MIVADEAVAVLSVAESRVWEEACEPLGERECPPGVNERGKVPDAALDERLSLGVC